MAERVTALVLSWNDRKSTLETLESVRGLLWPDLEVMLVDNGSVDGTVEAVRERFPDVTVVASLENLGAAAGRNLGLKQILRRPVVEYVLFLDNDVLLEPLLLDRMFAAMRGAPDVGILGPVVCLRSEPERVWSAGKRHVFRETPTKMIRSAPKPGLTRVDSITGCCMLVRRAVLEKAGLFDPQFFLAAEDSDLCARAAKAGFKSAVTGDARVLHAPHSSTGGAYVPHRAYYTARCAMLFAKVHGSAWRRVTACVAAALSLPVAWLRERRRGNARAVAMKLRGYIDGLLGRPVPDEVARHFGAPPAPHPSGSAGVE